VRWRLEDPPRASGLLLAAPSLLREPLVLQKLENLLVVAVHGGHVPTQHFLPEILTHEGVECGGDHREIHACAQATHETQNSVIAREIEKRKSERIKKKGGGGK
jgi:hypothetical protein